MPFDERERPRRNRAHQPQPWPRPVAPAFRNGVAPGPGWLDYFDAWPPGVCLGAAVLASLGLWALIGVGIDAVLTGAH